MFFTRFHVFLFSFFSRVQNRPALPKKHTRTHSYLDTYSAQQQKNIFDVIPSQYKKNLPLTL